MRSNYKRLGPYIQQVDIRNKDDKRDNLLGVSVSKNFIESIANTVGTNFKRYKVVKKGQFTYIPDTSRRGDKIAIALLEDKEQGLVSQAYTVFEVIDTDTLLSEYLMMWFRRPEFDRYARFISHGSVREIFSWEDMCDVKLPIPPIEEQRKIVKEYNIIRDRVRLNNKIVQKLGMAVQAVYKQWFVDYEFPDNKGRLYKSDGGEMKYNEDLDKEIPKDWINGSLNEVAEIIDGDRGKNYPSQGELMQDGYCLFLNAGNVSKTGFNFSDTTFISKDKDKLLRKGKLARNDVIITSRGTVGNVAYYSDIIPYKHIRINSGMLILRGKDNAIFIYFLLKNNGMRKEIESFLSGSAQQQLPIKDLVKIPIIIPSNNILNKFTNIGFQIQRHIDLLNIQNLKLNEVENILQSKIARNGGR